MLFKDGVANWSHEKALKGQNAMGVSVIEVKKSGNDWQVVRPSTYARRITVNTPMQLTGPARQQDLMKTAADPQGEVVLGTMQNCANGFTPWGTYLTCEENWSDIFVKKAERNALEKRYGISDTDASYRWNEVDDRFNVDKTPNEPNRFGWVVEIDPYNPSSTPRKHTALGRFKHEGAAVTLASDNRVVVYMGDDQKFEYIYKFISDKKYDSANREAGMQLLESGTLYVAKFNDDGSGDWLPLVFGENGLDKSNGFENQGDLLIKTRLAADTVGATKMDRPEWIAVDPHSMGSVYCTLTNNSDRGMEGKAPVDAANPRAANLFGHISTGMKKTAIRRPRALSGIFWCWRDARMIRMLKPKGRCRARSSAARTACHSTIAACCGSRPTSLPAPSTRKIMPEWAITRWSLLFPAPMNIAASSPDRAAARSPASPLRRITARCLSIFSIPEKAVTM